MQKKYLLFAFLILIAGSWALAAGMLDGRTFEATGGEKGKEAVAGKDNLVFANGKFHSTECDQYGFTAAAYTSAKEGDSVKFTAHATSEKEGSINWTGMVKGDTIEGTYVWTKTGQKDIEYWFKGTLKK